MDTRWLIRSQSLITLAGGMIYPYYLLFLKNLGNSFSKYGLAFAVFTISSAAASQWLAPRLEKQGLRMLTWSSIGMMSAMLAFPWVESYAMVLLLQLLMGICNAMQKMSERLLLAEHTEAGGRGAVIGSFHFWTSAASGLAVLLGGYVIDWLTIQALFYVSAMFYGWSAWMTARADRRLRIIRRLEHTGTIDLE
ncbi:putative MFS family arabinose efflux permease [Paenibacillus phyllosphaerae]|uniref:Putative MFS family arabinose efflux permease n=1 Tax=Paenibacillus phyllosphaerae TaxID=274593 RepID=A0A7W5FQW9_9BACL|nr:MFS transporter [Paenibacillus phyllosphaerae]MBB3113905.1 putative MFS family arabinose efflux permease [Paenibacillus phyllosphaerae]